MKNQLMISWFGLLAVVFIFAAESAAQEDERLTRTRTNRDFYTFPKYNDLDSWLERRAVLREHLLTSFGMLPLPKKTPLNPQVTKRIERDDYLIENVYIESSPGYFVTGNLYRPKGEGPYPGVLSAHGHWPEGRFANNERGSVPGRAINLARQGYVVFSFDMVGYGDSRQLEHELGGKTMTQWGVSLHGLQYWNSLRALDYLAGLPQVDAQRLAMTGASGGGTQTLFLMALDERITCAAPVNMISSHFQGGSQCENAPNLRRVGFNTEFAAMMAPRPLLMVSASGDWTNETPWLEYPAVHSIYKQYEAEKNIQSVQIDAPHNYNRQSRDAVYQWFARWVLDDPNYAQYRDEPFEMEPVEALKVFPDELPEHAMTKDELVAYLIQQNEQMVKEHFPNSPSRLNTLHRVLGTALQRSLTVEQPNPNDLIVKRKGIERLDTHYKESLLLSRRGVNEHITVTLFTPLQNSGTATLLVMPPARAASHEAEALALALVEQEQTVMLPKFFVTANDQRDHAFKHFYTYNPSITAMRVQDVLTCRAFLQTRRLVKRVNVMGQGSGGFWTLLAAPFTQSVYRVAVDANAVDRFDDSWFVQNLFSPSLRRAGDIKTAQAMLAPKPLLIYNMGEGFPVEWAKAAYGALDASTVLTTTEKALSANRLVQWLSQ